MKKAKLLCLACALMLVAGMLAACGSPASSVAPPSSTPSEASSVASETPDEENAPVTLRFSWWGGDTRHQATLESIALYEEQNSHVTIEAEYGAYSDYYEKLLIQLAGNAAPHITQTDYKWIPDFLRENIPFANLLEMPDLIGFDTYDMDYVKTYAGNGDDVVIGVPMGINGMGVIYNVQLFEDAGIDTSYDWDWDDVIEAGKKLQAYDSSMYLQYNIMNNYVYYLRHLIKQRNGNNFILDDYTFGFTRDELVDAFAYLDEMVKTNTVVPFAEAAAYPNMIADQVPGWLEGRYATFPTSTSNFIAVDAVTEYELDVMRWPVMDDAADPSIMITPTVILSVYEPAGEVEESAKFIDWFCNSDESILITKDTRGVPSNTKARDILQGEGLISDTLQKMLDQAISGTGSPENALTMDNEVMDIMKTYIDQIGFQKATPEQAADGLMADLERLLAERKAAA